MSLLNPQSASVQQARKLMEAGQHFLARQACEQILQANPKDTAAMHVLAQMDWLAGDREQAVRRLDKVLRLAPKDANARIQLAVYLNYLSRHKEAIAHYEKVRKLRPDDLSPIEGIAAAHETADRRDAARSLLAPFVGTPRETSAMGLVLAKIELRERQPEVAVEIARRHLAGHIPDPETRIELLYILGQALERMDDIDGAFKAYFDAHQVKRQPFDQKEWLDAMDRLFKVYTPQNFARMPRASNRSETPIFVVSRPRSGSTLVERILSAHPDVHDAGERPFFSRLPKDMAFEIGSMHDEYPECALDLEQEDVDRFSRAYLEYLRTIDRRAKRISNKDLTNWLHLGLIELVCPGARIIDVRREAVDNCFSCYTVNLGPSQAFSYDLGDLGFMHRIYERVMDHWKSILTIPVLRIDYEDLVQDLEGWSRKIIDFVGLPWNDRCLNFHEHGGKGSAVFTLSYAQVRQPIYKTSVGRAEKFRKHLGPLLETLGE